MPCLERTVRAPPRIDAEYRLAVKGSSQPLRISSIGAIAGSHNLVLPSPLSPRAALREPLEICYRVLTGKHDQGPPEPAVLTHLAEREAWIETRGSPLEPFMNLVLRFPGISGEAHGKVRQRLEGSVRIVFTVLPADLREWIRSLGPP